MLSLSVSFSNAWVAPMAPTVRPRAAIVTMVEPSNLDLSILDTYMSLPVQGKIQVGCKNFDAKLRSRQSPALFALC